MSRDIPVERKMFTIGLVVIFAAPVFAVLLTMIFNPGSSNGVADWYPYPTVGGAVLVVLSYIYGRTPDERARERKAGSA